MTVNELKQLPNIELHCHLDGSLKKKLVETRLQRAVSFEDSVFPMSVQALWNI